MGPTFLELRFLGFRKHISPYQELQIHRAAWYSLRSRPLGRSGAAQCSIGVRLQNIDY